MEKTLKMVKVNKIKDKEQRKALNAWAKNNFKGSVIAGTGFGKSRVGVMAIEHILKLEDSSKAMVLVPTIQLQDQFSDELSKWGLEHLKSKIDILCYQSAYKLLNQHYDIVVCDEIHLGMSCEYRKFFENNTYDNILCMTATEPEELEYKDLLYEIAPKVYEITLDECVTLKIVAPYSIYCVPVNLTIDEREQYKKVNNSFIFYRYNLGHFDAFNEAQRIMASKSATGAQKRDAHMFYKSIRDRKKIVDFAENKIECIKKLAIRFINKKILTFSGANEFTDRMCEVTQPLSVKYHSKMTKKQKEKSIEDFKNGNKSILCSTKALNQGLDVQDAEIGIICGLNSKSLSMIQRVGRLLRYKKNKTGKIIILYVSDSQEEKWLKSSIKNLNNVSWLNKLEEVV